MLHSGLAHGGDVVRAFIGTYNNRGGEGVYVLELDRDHGTLTEARLAAKQSSASFLNIHPNRQYLYAVSEVETTDGKKGGGVSAYKIDPASGKLERINGEITRGGGPCHLVVDPTGTESADCELQRRQCRLPANQCRWLAQADQLFREAPRARASIPDRQKASPYAHSINVDPTGDYAIVADLGLDKILVYKFDADHGQLTPNEPPSTSTKAGRRAASLRVPPEWQIRLHQSGDHLRESPPCRFSPAESSQRFRR